MFRPIKTSLYKSRKQVIQLVYGFKRTYIKKAAAKCCTAPKKVRPKNLTIEGRYKIILCNSPFIYTIILYFVSS